MQNPNTSFFWNKKIISEDYKLSKSSIYIDKNNTVLKYLANASGKLLNIGIGYGQIESLLNVKNPYLRLYGFDIAHSSIKLVKKRARGKFVIGNALSMPFKNQRFNYVLALDILEHFSFVEQSMILNQIRDVITKNGIFVVSVPLNEKSEDSVLNRHIVSFTKKKLHKLLDTNGFKIMNSKSLFAFKKHYFLKSLLSKYFFLRKPNLLIVKSIKK